MSKTTTPPRTKPETPAAAPEADLLSAEETRETRALIARAMRSAARFAEAHPEHASTPQLLSALSSFWESVANAERRTREAQILTDVVPHIA